MTGAAAYRSTEGRARAPLSMRIPHAVMIVTANVRATNAPTKPCRLDRIV
jgi:hypothetical protein